MNERLEAVVSGRVQLVMYRDFVQRKATALKLVGRVRNLPDGTVRIIAEGPRASLETLLKKLAGGSLLSRVAGVAPAWFPATNAYTSFEIDYDRI